MTKSHIYLMNYLSELGNINGKTLIEIGSARENLFTSSTHDFLNYTKKHNMNFISVDMDPQCTNNVEILKKKLNLNNSDKYKAINAKGEDFLEDYDRNIDFIYLDAFDFWHSNHSSERRDRYKKILNCDIVPDDILCHKMHLTCCQIINSKSNPNTVICFDDVINKNFDGKGKTAIPFLLNNGWNIKRNYGTSIILTKN